MELIIKCESFTLQEIPKQDFHRLNQDVLVCPYAAWIAD